MLVSHNVKRSGSKGWRQERFVACEVWSRFLLLTADYPLIMPKKLTLQRDGIPITSLTMYVPIEFSHQLIVMKSTKRYSSRLRISENTDLDNVKQWKIADLL